MKRRNFRRRFWVEVALASVTALLCVITPIWPDWIEIVFNWDPDQHNGSVEWMIAGLLLIVTVATFSVAAVEWRRTAAETSL